MKFGRASLLASLALASGIATHQCSAAVTAQGWWHYGEVADYYADSSGNAHRFGQAFSSCVGSGQAGAVTVPFGVGGPLGPTGFASTSALRWGAIGCSSAGMWAPGFNPPATNYGIETWVLPVDAGVLGGNSTWIFGSGSSGGVSFRLTRNLDDGTSSIAAVIIGSNIQIGDAVTVDTNRWMHLAIVNEAGTSTFYVDGVAHGTPNVGGATIPAGDIFGGSSPGTTPTFNGYLDELRIFTFGAGQFSTADLLLRPPGPNIVTQPQSETVWTGGAAPFEVTAAIDSTDSYQWQRGGVNIPDATSSEYYLPMVTLSDSGAVYDVVITNATGSVTSSNATLTVVAQKTADVNYYREAVRAESSLIALFPVDGNTGLTLTNVVEPAFSATLEGNAEYDGRTNRAFGERSLRLKGDGDATIANNPDYEFPTGNGTIEALVYLDKALAPGNETIFSLSSDATTAFYKIQVSSDGSSILYANDFLTQPLTWAIPVPLLGRFAHVAVVFETNNVTAYVDGQSLGTKANPSFGTPGLPAYIGSTGLESAGVLTGTIDELAIYANALSANTIAVHNSRFLFGTNVSVPAIVSQPLGAKTLLAGGSPTFSVVASGTAPLTYQWFFKGAPMNGQTSATLSLNQTSVASSGNYSVRITNPIGFKDSQDFTVNFVVPSDNYAKLVLADNPSAFWRLDETNGTTAFDQAGGHDGAYSGAVTQGATGALPGISDSAAEFASLGDGKVSVPYSATLNPSTPFSIEYWANPKTHTPDGATFVPMGSQLRNGAGRLGWAFYMENDGPGWEVQTGDSTGAHALAYSTTDADVPGRYDHIVAVYDGINTIQLIVNNKLEATASGGFVPNPSAPWIIGQRNDGTFGFGGSIDEVAFYNYALSMDQISNHFSIAFVPASILTQPTNIPNAIEAGSVTLTVSASGYPNTYQWYKGDIALDPTAVNFDNSLHYPQGVTGTALVISQLTADDAGQYHVVIANALGDKTSATANVTVANDTTAPTVVFVGAGSTNLVRVAFSRPISANTISLPTHYSISGGVTVSDVAVTQPALASSASVVDLITSGLTPGQQYTVSVTGVKDTRANQNLIGPNSTTFTAPVLQQGILNWDFYENIEGTSVDALTGGDLQYPNAVYTNLVLTNFTTMPITGGDLAGNPGFGSLGNNYGSHVYGWITPKESANYTFFIRSDDASELWLSSDAQAANVTEIASEPTCCHGFLDQNEDGSVVQTSQPIHLDANTNYYIEAFQKEGGGGDFVEVAWRKEGDTTAVGSLTPIPGSVLSAYGPVVVADLKFNAPTLASGIVNITWTGVGTLQESSDFVTWTPVAGNPASGFSVTPAAGTYKFYRLVH